MKAAPDALIEPALAYLRAASPNDQAYYDGLARIFDRASEFILDRSPNPHLAFGLGIHSCLGSTLARLEGRIAVTSLLRHLDGISLFEPDMEALDGFGAPASVRVELRRAA